MIVIRENLSPERKISKEMLLVFGEDLELNFAVPPRLVALHDVQAICLYLVANELKWEQSLRSRLLQIHSGLANEEQHLYFGSEVDQRTPLIMELINVWGAVAIDWNGAWKAVQSEFEMRGF